MRIGITQRHLKAEKGADRDALENDYVEYYTMFGITLIPIPNVLPDVEKFCKEMKIEGFIISGGMGVPATLWGEEIKYPNNYSEKRTATDKHVLDYAIKHKLPVLGICTGVHYMNVYFGGTLWQDMKEETDSNVKHVAKDHDITITDAKAKEYVGIKETKVNSFHNQGLKKISSKLKPWASCPEDNTVEALYHPDYPIVGMTWHPERKSPDKQFNKKIIEAFVDKKLFWDN